VTLLDQGRGEKKGKGFVLSVKKREETPDIFGGRFGNYRKKKKKGAGQLWGGKRKKKTRNHSV